MAHNQSAFLKRSKASVIIFRDQRSGNCLKVKYTADKLRLSYDWHAIYMASGESRTPEYSARNPQGQVPCLKLDNGTVLAQSNAIIRYLAAGTELLANTALAQAKVDEWLFWEQYSHEPYVAACRFEMVYQGLSAAQREPERVRRGELALAYLDAQLEGSNWLANDAFSIADIALLAYSRLAREGGFDLAPLAALRDWIMRCEQQLGI
jgi:glutathione S-transferase